MQERAFDALQKGNGPALLVVSTVLLMLLIIGGGMFMRYKEMEWRRKHAEEEAASRDETPDKGSHAV
jgi:hypothetical protein